jgi:hypothetical protein
MLPASSRTSREGKERNRLGNVIGKKEKLAQFPGLKIDRRAVRFFLAY